MFSTCVTIVKFSACTRDMQECYCWQIGIIPGCSLETMSTISYLSFNQVKFCIICTQTFLILALDFIIIKKTENTESNRWE